MESVDSTKHPRMIGNDTYLVEFRPEDSMV